MSTLPTESQLLNDPISSALLKLSPDTRALLLAELRKRQLEGERGSRFFRLYPDPGTSPLSRDKYPKHLEFFAAGAIHTERALMGGNRSGKSFCAGYEATCHLTGRYPDWWIGRRWDHPVQGWIAGEDVKSLRESLQVTLFGRDDDLGTGLIPREDLIGKPSARSGTAGAYDAFRVRHVSGGISRGVMKSYDQGREAFQAAQLDFVMLDEEPPIAIYTECLMRIMSTDPMRPNGLIMAAFTPLKGMSDVVKDFLPHLQLDVAKQQGQY